MAMDGKCRENCPEKQTSCIPFFAHENTVMHLSIANKRLLIALCVVCATFILTIIIFVHGYTVREKNWLDTLYQLKTPVAEVSVDGVHQQPDS